MPNIRILVKAVIQIFYSQGCSYIKFLCPENGSNSTENLRVGSKVNYFIYPLVCNYLPNIRILVKAILQIFRSQGCSLTKCLYPKRGVTQPNFYGMGSKVNQFTNTLVSNYMPNIRILAKSVLKIFCSQGCFYTKCLWAK